MDADVMRARLAREIERAMERAEGAPMRWGRNDCTMWCANIIRRAIRRDPALDLRGKYYGQATAYRLIMEAGGLAEGLRVRAAKFGWREVSVSDAQVGDLGVGRSREGQSVMLRLRPGYWVRRTDRGFGLVPDSFIAVAWSVC